MRLRSDAVYRITEEPMEFPLQNSETQNSGNESRFNTEEPRETRSLIKSLGWKRGLSVVTIISTRKLRSHAFLQSVFDLLEQHDIRFDFVTISEIAVSVVLDRFEQRQALARELGDIGRLKIESDKATVCVVASPGRRETEFASQVFRAIQEINVNLICQSEKGSKLHFVVSEKDLDAVALALFERFFEKPKSATSTSH